MWTKPPHWLNGLIRFFQILMNKVTAYFKRLPEQNIWISIGLASFGFFLLKFSDLSVIIKIVRWILPNLSSDFVYNILLSGGSLMLFAAFGTFFLWMTAHEKKRKNKRKLAMEQAAQTMGWTYSEYPSSRLRNEIDSLIANRMLADSPHLHSRSQSTSHFLSAEIDGDLLAVFDYTLSARNDSGETSTDFETAYLLVSDKLNLPYFQTQPDSFIGDNAVGNYFKKKAGITDIEFPQRPVFSKKYVVDCSQEAISRVFTPPIFDFYEQNQLYRTIGDGKMLCLMQWQTEPLDQLQINTQLQTLRYLYQLLKSQ